MTWQEKALQGQTNRTGHPTGTRSPPGLAWKLRPPLGMTRSQGPSATASTSATRRQAAGMASAATTRRSVDLLARDDVSMLTNYAHSDWLIGVSVRDLFIEIL